MYCFLCGVKCESTINLRDYEELETFCFDKILETPIDDDFIPRVCIECHDKLRDFCTFVKHCKVSYQHIRTKPNSKLVIVEIVDEQKLSDDDIDNSKELDKKAKNTNKTDTISKEKSQLCPICGKLWPSRSKMTKHMLTHTKQEFKCQYCGKVVTKKTTLLAHERIHTGEKPYECEYCGKGFTHMTGLKHHRKLHTGKDNICQVCGKGYCRPSELRVHMRTHTGEMPFECKDCGKHFQIASHLKDHERVHMDRREFVCKFCGRGFNKRGVLLEHESTHTGIYRHHCELCNYGTKTKSRLNNHMQKCHDDIEAS